MAPLRPLARDFQIASVTIDLINTVHIHEHGKAGCNVAMRGEVDGKRGGCGRDGDVGGDIAIGVRCVVFFEGEVRGRPLNVAGKVFEGGHGGLDRTQRTR